MTIAISTNLITETVRYNSTQFTETSISYSYGMVPGGFKVPCGAPNASGKGSQYDLAYWVGVTAIDTNNNEMQSNLQYLYCPAYTN